MEQPHSHSRGNGMQWLRGFFPIALPPWLDHSFPRRTFQSDVALPTSTLNCTKIMPLLLRYRRQLNIWEQSKWMLALSANKSQMARDIFGRSQWSWQPAPNSLIMVERLHRCPNQAGFYLAKICLIAIIRYANKQTARLLPGSFRPNLSDDLDLTKVGDSYSALASVQIPEWKLSPLLNTIDSKGGWYRCLLVVWTRGCASIIWTWDDWESLHTKNF